MSDNENAATRLWRDRVQLREQERDEAQARARLAEEKVGQPSRPRTTGSRARTPC